MPNYLTTFDVLDIPKYLENKHAPATFVPREGKTWLVRDWPVDFDPKSDPELAKVGEWAWCKAHDEVRVPLFPYCSRADASEAALGFAFELGFKARDYVIPTFEIKKLHISLGSPIEEHEIEGHRVLRFWLGFAYILQERR